MFCVVSKLGLSHNMWGKYGTADELSRP